MLNATNDIDKLYLIKSILAFFAVYAKIKKDTIKTGNEKIDNIRKYGEKYAKDNNSC